MGLQATRLASDVLTITLTIQDLLARGRLREVGELVARRGEIIGRLSSLSLPEQVEADAVVRQTLELLMQERRRLAELCDAAGAELGAGVVATQQVSAGSGGVERREALWWA